MTTPSTPRIVPLGPELRAEVLRVDQAAFGFDPDEVDPTLETEFFEWDRTFGALRPVAGAARPVAGATWSGQEELAGLNTSYSLSLTVPGRSGVHRQVPMAALSWVSVHPDHRRRGVLSAMMRHHFDQVRERGEPLAGLFASEPAIYQRYGYGDAAPSLRVTLPKGCALRALPERPGAADGPEVVTSMTDADGPASLALVDEVFDRAAPTRVGRLTRPLVATQHFLTDRPERRKGREPRRLVVARRAGRTTGYAVLQRTLAWTDGVADGKVEVHELTGLDAPTLHALWTRVLDIDLMGEVSIPLLGPDDPLLAWLVDLRTVTARRQDGLWLRLVDLPRAMTARGYDTDLDAVISVQDRWCPWNAGTWRLAVAGDDVSCIPTQDTADLSLDIQELSAAYLGGRSLASMAAAGLVAEHSAGAVAVLSRALRGDSEPVVPQMF